MADGGENADPQLQHDPPPPPKSSIVASDIIPPLPAYKGFKALRHRMKRDGERRGRSSGGGVAPPPPSSGGDGRDGGEDVEAGSRTSEEAGDEVVQGGCTKRDDALLLEDDVGGGDPEKNYDSIHRRSSFHLEKVGSGRSIPSPSPPDNTGGSGTAEADDDASVDSAMRRIGAECTARAAPLDAILAEIAGPIVPAAVILDEAHRLLSVTSTNSIDELEEILSPTSIPDVIFARHDWEERTGPVVAALSLHPPSPARRRHSPATAETAGVGARGDERSGRRDDAVGGDGIGIGRRIPSNSIAPPDESETVDAGSKGVQMVSSDDAVDELESCDHKDKEMNHVGMSTGDDGGASRFSGEIVPPSTESFFVETLLNNKAKKAKESSKRTCGVVRSRVSNIQKRIQFPSASFDEGGSHQIYKHPRVCMTAPHRSIPIGIAKTYNKKNSRSPTRCTNFDRTSSRF